MLTPAEIWILTILYLIAIIASAYLLYLSIAAIRMEVKEEKPMFDKIEMPSRIDGSLNEILNDSNIYPENYYQP